MAFLRVVEIFPPLYPIKAVNRSRIDLDVGIEQFVAGAESVKDHADIILVANVKIGRASCRERV